MGAQEKSLRVRGIRRGFKQTLNLQGKKKKEREREREFHPEAERMEMGKNSQQWVTCLY